MSDASIPAQQRNCLNCGEVMQAEFCGYCGQQEKEVRQPLLYFMRELLRVLLELDGRAYRTVFYLLTRPGHLTLEYFAGHRVKYTPPLRLFLFVSIVFFLSIAVFNTLWSMQMAIEEAALAQQTEIPVDSVNPEPETPLDDSEQGDSNRGIADAIDFFATLELPFLSPQTNENLQVALSTQLRNNLEEVRADPEDFVMGSLEYITFFMLLLMPVLAVIQQALWVLSRRYYVEHLILTLHNHTFLILMVFVTMVLGAVDDMAVPVISEIASWFDVAAMIWIVVYLLLSLKRYFQAGWLVTTALYLAASFAYVIVFFVGILVFAMLLVLFA